MDVVMLIFGFLCLFVYICTTLYKLLSGGTKSKVAGSPLEHARVIEDLGEVRRTFTNYSPWRMCFSVLLLVIELSGLVIGIRQMRSGVDYGLGLVLFAGFSLLFTVWYVASMGNYKFELHTRGFVLRAGKSKARAAYYPDIAKYYYRIAEYEKIGGSDRVVKALVIELHDGGRFEIGRDFLQFGKITDAITELANTCAVECNLCGAYIIRGRTANDNEPIQVEVEARSPRHARTEALNRYGVIAEDCSLRSKDRTM
jgi:hypothetical protein